MVVRDELGTLETRRDRETTRIGNGENERRAAEIPGKKRTIIE